MTASNQAFSAFSFLSFVLTANPFTWHLQAWNTGTCIYIGWISLSSLLLFINSVVWNGSVVNRTPIYCDISTKILVGASVALPAVALCISRRLYHAISINAITKTKSEKRKGVLVDLAVGIGIPIIIMILHVIVQSHRYDIFEDVGCWPTIYNTALAYVLVLTPPLGLSLVALVYSALCVVALKRNYVGIKEILLISQDQVTPSRYIRLLCLAGIQALFNIPIHLYVIITYATKSRVEPWISWKNAHSDFNRFETFTTAAWRTNRQEAIGLERIRWTMVASGLLFFILFGFASEAIQNYKRAHNFFARKLGLKLAPIPTSQAPSSAWFYGNWSGQSDATLGHQYSNNDDLDADKKERGTPKLIGRVSLTSRFDAFVNKIKSVISHPLISRATISRQSTLNNHGPSTISRSEVTERQREFSMDVDAMSAFTQLTDFTGSTIPGFFVEQVQQATQPTNIPRRRSPCVGSVNVDGRPELEHTDSDDDDDDSTVQSEAHTSIVDSISVYSQPSPLYPSSPVPPAVPPKDPACVSPTTTLSPLPGNLTTPPSAFLHPQSYYYQRDFIQLASAFGSGSSPSQGQQQHRYHYPQQPYRRTPPKQAIPVSVSASPTPNGSFLDLRASVGSELPPTCHVHSADSEV